MKKGLSMILVLAMCLALCACGNSDSCTCDCPACAQCEKKAQNIAESTTEISASAEENSGNKIVFPEPVLLAEDNTVRVELISFFEEKSPYKDIGKYVALKFTNKAAYEIGVDLENLAVENIAVDCSYQNAQIPKLLPGETTTYFIEIRDTFHNALDSLNLLYTLKGRFEVMERTGSNTYKDAYELPFSVAATLEQSVYYGKWQVTNVTLAEENTSAADESDAVIEEVLAGILEEIGDMYIIFSESGDCFYNDKTGAITSRWKATETGVKAGSEVFTAEGDQLVSESAGFLLHWEKVSDSQEFPKS